MLAYKFRGADQIPFALDILLKRRLYCADWSRMNDPMEGRFSYSITSCNPYDNRGVQREDHYHDLADEIVDEKKKCRICSLTLNADSRLLWAHYASGFTGLALELELPDDSPNIRPVTYPERCADVDLDNYQSPLEEVKKILTTKLKDWEYEQEIRILQKEQWFELPRPVTRVICGSRMNHAMFEALQMVCAAKEIPISRMHIDDEGIDLSGGRNPSARLARAWQEKQNPNKAELDNA